MYLHCQFWGQSITPVSSGDGTLSISIEPIETEIGARVLGVDLTNPLAQADVTTIVSAIDRHAVLVFPDQHLDDDAQRAFTLNFGSIENARGGHVKNAKDNRLSEGLIDVSNINKDGALMAKDSRHHLFNIGNMLWHSDSSFRAIPASYSILSARETNPVGGNTEFANMRAAYAALSDAEKAEVEDLICEHSLMYSRGALGFLDFSDEEIAMFRPVRQRLVRTHPNTGEKSLFLSSHAGDIVGMEMPMARILLRDLTEHATQPRFVYAHRWQAGDLVMWDNQQTMHRVRRYDESQPRDMRRTTVAGQDMTIDQAA